MEKIERGGAGNPGKMLFALGGLELKKSVSRGVFTDAELELYKNLIIAIIKKDHNIGYDTIIRHFNDPDLGGFFTMADVELFEEITENSYKKEDVMKILDLTESGVSVLPSYLDDAQQTESSRNLINQIIKMHPSIKEYIEKNML